MAKYFTVVKTIQLHEKKHIFNIVNKKLKSVLGRLFWYKPWKQFVFQGLPDSVFSEDCLEEIRQVILYLNKEFK